MNYYDNKPPVVDAPPPAGYPTAYPAMGQPPPPQTVYVNQPPTDKSEGCCGCLAGCLAGICCCLTLDICF